MFLSSSLVFSALACLFRGVKAEDTAIVVDFFTDVLYDPPDAWFSQLNDPCNAVDHYTAQINASASLTFTGDRIEINGMQNNVSGILRVLVDDQEPYDVDLFTDDVQCDLFVDYYVGNGTHNITLVLLGRSEEVSEGLAITPVLHLTEMVYWVPDTSNTSQTSPSGGLSSPPSAQSASHVGAIVGGVVGGIAALGIIALGLFYYFKRRMPWSQKGRHSFDPTAAANTVYITELSPRSPRSPTSPKFQPYARMEDDGMPAEDTKSGPAGHLGVPALPYVSGRGGLRSRSRSPNPEGDRTGEDA